MNWKGFILAGVVLAAGTGCVEFWSKEGIIQEAVSRDTHENLPGHTCPDGKPRQYVCSDPKKPAQCEWKCE